MYYFWALEQRDMSFAGPFEEVGLDKSLICHYDWTRRN